MGTDDPKLVHNRYAPNKQNILCDYRSTSEVIEEHQDFKTLNTSALSDKYYEPVIRYLRIDSQQSSRFVLVLDVSGSMRDNGRIKLLNRAATRFVKDLIPNNFELGIIEFATNASIVHRMVRVNDTTRQSLIEAIPSIAEGWTAIGKGFKLALDILREGGGHTRGATIILVSDGEENQKEPTVDEIMPEMLEAGIKVDSIAVAIEADKRLENISSVSGGRCFYMKDSDDATNTLMETAFMGFVSQQVIQLSLNLY